VKKGIHPKYYPEAKVICACGNTWTTGSTQEVIHTEMCSACHPFFTGEQRIVDTAGQVERFRRRVEKAERIAAETARRHLDKQKAKESLFEFVEEGEEPVPEEVVQEEAQPVAEEKPKAKRKSRKKTKAAAKAEAASTAEASKEIAEASEAEAASKAKSRKKKSKAVAKAKTASRAKTRKKAASTESSEAEKEAKSPTKQAGEPAAEASD